MYLYKIVVFLHVGAVVLWVGSGFGLLVLGLFAERAGDRNELAHLTRQSLSLARFQGPMAGVVLVFGVAAAWLSWSFADLWIDIGIAAFVLLFLSGLIYFAPRINRAIALFDNDGATDAAVAEARDAMMAARFDYTLLLLVVADMVFKPRLADWPVLLVMAILLAAAWYFFLSPWQRSARTA